MCRNDIFKTCQPGNNFFQIEERGSAGVTFISEHDTGPLSIAHGSCSRIGDKVDINLF